MRYTNVHQIPEALAEALRSDDYVRRGDFSVTEIIKPPQIVALERRYDADIVVDVSTRLWLLLGSAVHYVLDRRQRADNRLIEEPLTAEVHGLTIAGKPDLYEPDGTLSDYKVTSAYSFTIGDHVEWEQQLNSYAWLYRKHGFAPKRLEIRAILRDWSAYRCRTSRDFPPIPFTVKQVPMWGDAAAGRFVCDRLALQVESLALPDEALPACTDEERWHRPATRREGERWIRCEDYCDVAPFCHQWRMQREPLLAGVAE